MATAGGGYTITAPSGLTREQRTLGGFGMVAWAYMAALWRGDWSRAPQVLAAFQALYNMHRAVLVAEFAAGADVLPRSLPVDGRLTGSTHTALLAGAMAGGPADIPNSVYDSMPSSAAALGSWFWDTLAPRADVSSGHWIWDIDRVVRGTSPGDVPGVVGDLFRSYVEGSATSASVGTRTTTTATKPTAVSPSIPSATPPLPRAALVAPAVGALPGWAWALIGVAAVGGAAYLVYEFGFRRKRR